MGSDVDTAQTGETRGSAKTAHAYRQGVVVQAPPGCPGRCLGWGCGVCRHAMDKQGAASAGRRAQFAPPADAQQTEEHW